MSKRATKDGMLLVKQIASPIRRDKRQTLYLKSLGLGRINRVRELKDNNSVRGLIMKLAHMVQVVQK